MSASNWAICPRCLQRAQRRLDDVLVAAHHAYGKVPVEEFEALRAEAATPIDPEQYRTFREDYEFYGVSQGVVTASYGASCEVCGLSLEFNHTEPIPGVDE